jgi:hypothetical protein
MSGAAFLRGALSPFPRLDHVFSLNGTGLLCTLSIHEAFFLP